MTPQTISTDEFASAMDALGPFERKPHVAVAVSGGADSMALALLMHDWAVARGGRVTALIVDHGLRAGAAAEAALAVEELTRHGITCVTLVWDGPKPSSNLQEAARGARYRLLEDWCRTSGVLHLAVAHHADDQAETLLMRLVRGSGSDGLAAMAAVREVAACRIIRPLLSVPKTRLVETLIMRGVRWSEDPSNRDPKYARTGLRRSITVSGVDATEIARGAERFARARCALEAETSRWFARFVSLKPEGWMRLPVDALAAVDEEIKLRVLARAACAVGGKVYPPAIAKVERLAAAIDADRAVTLAGAWFRPEGDTLGIYREARHLPAEMPFEAETITWDSRFLLVAEYVTARRKVVSWSPSLARDITVTRRPSWLQDLPDAARNGLPVIGQDEEWHFPRPGAGPEAGVSVRFWPKMPLSGVGFFIA